MLEKAGLFWRTVVHLKREQLLSRVALAFRRRFLYVLGPLVKWRYGQRSDQEDRLTIQRLDFGPNEIHKLLAGEGRLVTDNASGEYTFTFLNSSRSFSREVDWQPRDTTLLWRYNLHYFDYAYDLGVAQIERADERLYKCLRALVVDWHKSNPVAGTIGWDSYPTSLRVVNWIKAYHFFEEMISQDTAFRSLFLGSLYAQVSFLENNLEYHLLNNHIVENGRALLLGGLFFRGADAQRWRDRGVGILWQELRRQVCEDGGQFERSPMYHAAVLLVYAEAATVLENCHFEVPRWVTRKIEEMVRHLALMCHPDGEIAFFNDAALGMTPPAQSILKALSILGYDNAWDQSKPDDGLVPLPDSGYYLMHCSGQGHYCVFDCGPLGPDYQPGHGHCDTLSYEWSFRGKRVIVDSGVDDYYRQDDWRSYYRSTRAHNTVMVDGQEQSEIWGNFRVGRRAHPLSVDWHTDDRIITVCGGHNGYEYLPGDVLHYRSIALIDSTVLIVFDRILGSKNHHIESFIHFHPELELATKENHIAVEGHLISFALLPFGSDISSEIHRGSNDPLQGWYAPEFGQRLDNGVVTISWKGELPFEFGYCLLPISGETSLRWRIAEHGYVLRLRRAEQTWMLECSDSISLIE
jgi:uncharacterized heparinase superfamily protein